MSFDRVVEAKIREALEQGHLEKLRGSGKPLRLEEYFSLPEETRLTYTLLKDSGFVPEEVHLLREINELKAQLEEIPDEDERRRELRRQVEDKTLKLNLLLEQYRRKRSGKSK